MLTPDYLEHISDDIIKLYSELEKSIVKDIAKRLIKTNLLIPSVNHQVKVLQESGMLYEDIIKEISKITGKSEEKIKQIFENSAIQSINLDDEIYKKAGFNPIPLKQSESMLNMLIGGIEKTNKQINNLTMTLAGNSQAKFTNAVNLAYMQVTSGAFDKNTAILNAVKSLSEDGLDIIYPSGKTSKVDVAVRRAVVTGVNQTCGKLQEMRADEFECDLMELTAHVGARVTEKNDYTNHAWWQGRIVSRSGKKGYLSLSDIGYGEIQGFLGINCRHGWAPFFEGITKRRWSDKQLKELYNQSVTYNGKKINIYEAAQKQRAKERNIRKLKRELSVYEEIIKTSDDEDLRSKTSLNYNSTKNKLNRAQDEIMRFTKETGLKREYERERVINNKNNVSNNKTKQNKDDIISISSTSLNDEEQHAINRYISSDSYKINNMLRNDIELNDDYTVFRNNLDSALNKCNNYQGNIVRVLEIKDKEELNAFIEYNKVGEVRPFKEYLSFSNKKDYNDSANIFIYTNSKTAKDLRKFNSEESEILYKRNSKFYIDNVVKKDGKYYILWSDVNE